MRVKSSKKGLYLTVMAAVAMLFILYLFISPVFLSDGVPARLAVIASVAVALALVGAVLFFWRLRMSRDVSLNRKEGVVSGQNEHPVKL